MFIKRLSSLAFVLVLTSPIVSQEKDKGDRDWTLLKQYIELGLPKADGTNITHKTRKELKARAIYYNEDAKEARMLELRPLPGLEEKLAVGIKQNLLRMHLAAVTAFHTDDLHGVLKTFKPAAVGMDEDQAKLLLGLSTADAKAIEKIPKHGWVIEVRGFTYHNKGVDLIRDSFIEALAEPEYSYKVPAELTNEIRERVLYVHLFESQSVKDEPIDDKSLLKRSPLKTLAMEGKFGKDVKVEEKITYMPVVAKRFKDEPVISRTEFAIWFVLRDVAAEKK